MCAIRFALVLVVLAHSALALSGRTLSADSYHELLAISPTSDGAALMRAEFNISMTVARSTAGGPPPHSELRHFVLFPKSIAQVLDDLSVTDLHVSLTSGHWDAARLGAPTRGTACPSGAAVRARFASSSADQLDSQAQTDRRWRRLLQALSGVLCASLNEIGPAMTSSGTQWDLPSPWPNDAQPQDLIDQRRHVYYGVLPRENVCTATAWTME